MKHSHNLLVAIHLLIATTACTAMNNKSPISQSKVLMELTVIKIPQSVICFPNNIIAIAGQDGCSLCDLSTNTEIKKLHDKANFLYISAHPNKTMLAIRSEKKLEVYDVATKNILWGKDGTDWNGIPTFNPIDNTILISNKKHGIDSFNYKYNTHTSWLSPLLIENTEDAAVMAFHPTKKECLIRCIENNKHKTILLDNDSSCQKHYLEDNYPIDDCRYSPDGSIIALNNFLRGSSIFSIALFHDRYDYLPTEPIFQAMAFNPTSFILATLTLSSKICPESAHSLIRYWNTKTRKLLATNLLFFYEGEACYNEDTNPFNKQIDFSCDGTKLIVALAHKCLVLEVPFEALYKNLTKDKCIFAHWILKNYQQQKNKEIPDEIIHLLSKSFLKASKYSLTNY